ncbi:MAG: hypothetical protein ACJAT4_002279 [Granulosicoccus sp.]
MLKFKTSCNFEIRSLSLIAEEKKGKNIICRTLVANGNFSITKHLHFHQLNKIIISGYLLDEKKTLLKGQS